MNFTSLVAKSFVAIVTVAFGSVSFAASCRIDGAPQVRIEHSGLAKAPPLYLEVCDAVVKVGPADVCYITSDARMQCVVMQSGNMISATTLKNASKESSVFLSVISRWLQGDLSVRTLVGRGNDPISLDCKTHVIQLPTGLLTLRAEEIPWRVTDSTIRSFEIITAGEPKVQITSNSSAKGIVRIPSGVLKSGKRYLVAMTLEDGCKSESSFRLVQASEQKAVDQEIAQILARSDVRRRSKALMISTFFDAEGLVFERDLWLQRAALETD